MKGVSCVAAVAASLWAAAELGAQERPRGEMESSLTIIARLSDISGDVDSDFDLDYGDLWDSGFGLAVESNFMFPLGKNWSIGPYVSAGFDVFQGDEATDDVGDTLEADDLFMSSLLFGFKAMLAPERGFFFDGRFGIGPVFWSEVDGELTIGGTPFDVTVFDASVSFAAELGAHVGFATPHVFFGGGFSVRTQGKPDEGDLAFEGTSNAVLASFELEVGFRF